MKHWMITMLAVGAAGIWAPAVADAPDLLSYQARLVDAVGSPIVSPTTLRFRIWRGGDATGFPSTGTLVYEETTTLTPGAEGLFAHMIGSGSVGAGCAPDPCALDAATFADAATSAWIEVTIDPDGMAGTADDDVLLPRTRIGTTPYAYRVASLDGAVGGSLTGVVEVDSLTGRQGATLGDGSAADVSLTFDGSTADGSILWEDAASRLRVSAPTLFEDGIDLSVDRSAYFGPFTNPTAGAGIRLGNFSTLVQDGNLDGVADRNQSFSICYNCVEGSPASQIGSEYSVFYNYGMTNSFQPGERYVDQTWLFLAPGQPSFRPYESFLNTDAQNAHADPNAKWTFRTSRSEVALHINQNGNVMVGANSPQPTWPLDVVGTIHTDARVRLERDQAVQFTDLFALEDDSTANALILGRSYPEVQLGDGALSMDLVFERGATTDTTLRWDATWRRFEFSDEARFEKGVTIPAQRAYSFGPMTNPVPGAYVRLRVTSDPFADGNLDGTPDQDHVYGVCYNCPATFSGGPEIATEYAMKAQWEWTYAPQDGQRVVENNWDFQATGFATFRPYRFFLDTDFDGGYADPKANWSFRTARERVALHISNNGNIRLGASTPQPQYQLEVVGTTSISEDLLFEEQSAIRFGSLTAFQDDIAASRLIVGGGYPTMQLRTDGENRLLLTATDVKINDDGGSSGSSFVLGSCGMVSAATNVDLGNCNVATFGGTATVEQLDTCDGARAGRVLHLLCGADATGFCDGDGARCNGGNLRLAGADADFTCSPDDVLTLLCDGQNWRQTGVSVN